MPWTISAEVEAALWSAAKHLLPRAASTGATLRQAVIERSRRYTSERELLAEPLSGRQQAPDLAARALFFTPADAAKVMIPLAELHGRGLLPGSALRILDVGAGTGAMTLGALDFLHRVGHRAPVTVHAVDRDGDALRLCQHAVSELAARQGGAARIAITTEHVELAAQRAPSADLILAGSVLNELETAGARALIAELLGALDAHGALIIVEPALRETARALHELRDWAVAEAGAHVFAPCTRPQAPCPMLEDERDWCHEDRPVLLPERTAKLAAATGLRSYGLKFSYLVLRRSAEPLVADPARASRVVSQPRKSKGKRECFACSEGGRSLVRLLKRNRSDENRAFERVRRGDVLIAEEPGAPAPAGDLAPDQRLTVLSPAAVPGADGEAPAADHREPR